MAEARSTEPTPPATAEATDSSAPGSRLIIVCGLPGTGKTTLAERWATERRAIRFGSDDWMLALGLSLWDSKWRVRIEALQWQTATQVLAVGGSVIIEWGTWSRAERDSLRTQAAALGAKTELAYLDVDLEELWRRIERRRHEDPRITRENLQAWRGLFEVPDPVEIAAYAAYSRIS